MMRAPDNADESGSMASPEKKAFLLRIDPAVWAEIERLAAGELRSVNAQVEYLLRDAMRLRKGGATVPATKKSPNR